MSQVQKPEETGQATFRTEVGYFLHFLESVDPWADQNEAKIVVSDGNVYSSIQDAAQIAMCIARIKGKALNDIRLDGTDRVLVALNIDKPNDVLSTCSNSSEVEITFPVKSSGGSMFAKFDVIDEDVEYLEPLIDPDSVRKMPEADPISHETRIVVDGTELKKTINRIDSISGDSVPVIFKTGGGIFEISIADKVQGRLSKKFRPSGPSEDVKLDEHSTKISSQKLKEITKTIGRGEEVEVHVRQDYPLRLDVTLDNDGDAKVIYIIAPRISSEG